jgi:8-oxo-dGTP pyrophosphatase MutT (NUDIX family)
VSAPPLRFRALGDWPAGRVVTRWSASGRRIVPELEDLIESRWREATANPHVQLFDGPMCRLETFEASGERLELTISRTIYKTFFGTHLADASVADRFGDDCMPRPLGVSPALLTGDGFLMFGRRNAKVAYHPGRIHPFSGTLEPDEADEVFAAVRRELREELRLSDDDVPDIRCLGIAEDLALRQPELIFRAHTLRTRAQIESSLDPTEHHETWSIPASADAVGRAISQTPELTPIAVATLLLWGRSQFGEAWFAYNSGNTS